ncbi:MAG: S8/S53 family peptidase [Candidatus Kariarchaeaceae archaeon]
MNFKEKKFINFGKYWIIFLLIISSQSIVLVKGNRPVDTFKYGYPIHFTGNGYDFDALNYCNLMEMKNTYANEFWDVNGELLHNTPIAIIDSGIDISVWKKLESEYGVNIDFYYYTNEFLKVSTTDAAEGDTHKDYVMDTGGHGNYVASVISQVTSISHGPSYNPVYFGAKILIFRDNDEPVRNYDDDDWDQDIVNKALDTIYNNGDPLADIISLSIGTSSENLISHDKITDLYSKDVRIFNSVGNEDHDLSNHNTYPAHWDEVWGIGSIFDDKDGYMNDDEYYSAIEMPSEYVGARVTKEKVSIFPGRKIIDVNAWGSNFDSEGNGVDFVGPGFEIEVYFPGEDKTDETQVMYGVVDGTSFSCPYVASIALLVYNILETHDNGIMDGNKDLLLKTLKHASEGITDEKSRIPTINTYYEPESKHDDYGYGAISAYDAVNYALNKAVLIWYDLLCPSVVSGTQTIYVNNFFNQYNETEIIDVKFYINNYYKSHDVTSLYLYNWNTESYSGQTVIVSIKIYDINGNIRTLTTSVYVTSPPPPPPPRGGGGLVP